MEKNRMFVVVLDGGMLGEDPEYVCATFAHLCDAIHHIGLWNARLGAMGAHFICSEEKLANGISSGITVTAAREAHDFMLETFGVDAYVSRSTGCQFRLDSVEGTKVF